MAATFAINAAEPSDDDQDADEEILVIEKKPEVINVPSTFGSSRIRNWYVLDNRTLIIQVTGRQKYKATLMNSCPGLRFTDSIGFATMGPWELDKWTTIHLPGGERCYVKELTRYQEPEEDKQ